MDELKKLSVTYRLSKYLHSTSLLSDSSNNDSDGGIAKSKKKGNDNKNEDVSSTKLIAEFLQHLFTENEAKKKQFIEDMKSKGFGFDDEVLQNIYNCISSSSFSIPNLSLTITDQKQIADIQQPTAEDKPITVSHEQANESMRPPPSQPASSSSKKSLSTQSKADNVYEAKVLSVTDFAAIVKVYVDDRNGEDKFVEGRIPLSQIKSTGRIIKASDELSGNQKIKVKVLSKSAGFDGKRWLFTMRDVEQAYMFKSNVYSSSSSSQLPASLTTISSYDDEYDEDTTLSTSMRQLDNGDGQRQKRKRIKAARNENDAWEEALLVQSGVLQVEDLPSFDQEHGLMDDDEGDDEDGALDVEVALEEPAFLQVSNNQHQSSSASVSASAAVSNHLPLPALLTVAPPKIVQNPDGSMQRAAMNQSTLAKERREIRLMQEQQLIDSIPKDIEKSWLDPMADVSERRLATEVRGITNVLTQPDEWKQKAFGNNVSYGFVQRGSIKEQRESLPIFGLKDALLKMFQENQVLIVIGETGSGKTTQMTQYFYEALSQNAETRNKIIGCTQPRRVAAISVAKRVAEEYGCKLGEEVGYTIRFEDHTSPRTIIKYMTDGMLMREYLLDNKLSKYSTLILDEAHERTIHTDVLFGLLKALMQRRKDLKLIVTSATLDAEKFSKYFFDCPIFTIPGRTFPVEIFYAREPETDYVEAALVTVLQIHVTQPAGDILVFLTGQEEIDTACEILFERAKALGPNAPELIILPVYGSLPSEMQTRIFESAPPGTRKCIVATNIAEASLTIDGIYYVVDPGFAKQNVYNPRLGMDSLVVVPISQASARQRAGRAGRTGPGKCYRLFTEEAFKTEMLPSSVPEIQRTNLGNVVLQLKAMGIHDIINFDFMDPPPAQTIRAALEHLYVLGCLDEEGLLTKLGRNMAEFPLEPVLAKTLLTSCELGCSEEVLTIVAMLSVENIFYRPKEKQAQADQKRSSFFQPEGDHITLLKVYNAWRDSKFSSTWCYDNYIQARVINRVQDVRNQLLGILEGHKYQIRSCGGIRGAIVNVQKSFTAGFFMHAAKRDQQQKGYRTLTDNQPVSIHPSSSLFNRNPEYVIYHELVLTSREYMRNTMLLNPKWLVECAPKFFKSVDATRLSKRKKQEKIEPLHDPRNPKDSWRLSRRQGLLMQT